jgi:hypothetical protein
MRPNRATLAGFGCEQLLQQRKHVAELLVDVNVAATQQLLQLRKNLVRV